MADVKICDSCGIIINDKKVYFATRIDRHNGWPPAEPAKFAYCKQCGEHVLRELERARKAAKKQIPAEEENGTEV